MIIFCCALLVPFLFIWDVSSCFAPFFGFAFYNCFCKSYCFCLCQLTRFISIRTNDLRTVSNDFCYVIFQKNNKKKSSTPAVFRVVTHFVFFFTFLGYEKILLFNIHTHATRNCKKKKQKHLTVRADTFSHPPLHSPAPAEIDWRRVDRVRIMLRKRG